MRLDSLFAVWDELPIEDVVLFSNSVEKYRVVVVRKLLETLRLGGGAPPHDFISEKVLPKDLIKHNFDVMAGVPVAVVVEAAGFLEHTM